MLGCMPTFRPLLRGPWLVPPALLVVAVALFWVARPARFGREVRFVRPDHGPIILSTTEADFAEYQRICRDWAAVDRLDQMVGEGRLVLILEGTPARIVGETPGGYEVEITDGAGRRGYVLPEWCIAP
jgi:hypothetical protein